MVSPAVCPRLFSTTLTCSALFGNHIVIVTSLPFVRACLEFLTTLTFRTPQENRIVSVPFETIEKKQKNVLFSMFLVSPGHLMTIQKPNSRMDDNRKIAKTAEKLPKSLPGPSGELNN